MHIGRWMRRFAVGVAISPSDAEVALAGALPGAVVVARDYGATRARFAKSASEFATETDVDAGAALVTVPAAVTKAV